jgi:hypothetical protein
MNILVRLVPTTLALCVAGICHAGVDFDTPQGKLSIGGNFEFETNYQHLNSTSETGADGHLYNSGRVELNIRGSHEADNGYYADFSLNPAWKINTDAIGDQYIGIGKKDDWFVKTGHYLNYDVAPIGLGMGDDLFNAGYEMYQVNDARGRADSQLTYSKNLGDVYFELSSMFGDDWSDHASSINTLPGQNATDYLYSGSGINVKKNKDPIVARPVLAWSGNGVSATVGAEINLVTDAYQSTSGVDLNKRNGVGGNITFDTSESTKFMVKTAYLDAVAHNQYTVGAGFKYQIPNVYQLYISYLYGQESIDNNTLLGTTTKGSTAHEIYVSNMLENFLGIDNAKLSFGGFWSQLLADDSQSSELAKSTDYGTRIRIRYDF